MCFWDHCNGDLVIPGLVKMGGGRGGEGRGYSTIVNVASFEFGHKVHNPG